MDKVQQTMNTEKVKFLTELLAESEKIERVIEDFNEEINPELLRELKSISRNMMMIIEMEFYKVNVNEKKVI